MVSKAADGFRQVFILPAIEADVYCYLFVIAMSPQQGLPCCLQQSARTYTFSGGGFFNLTLIITSPPYLNLVCLLLVVVFFNTFLRSHAHHAISRTLMLPILPAFGSFRA